MENRTHVHVWVIMSKDKKKIVKGNPRHRFLVRLDDNDDNKRVMIYMKEHYARGAMLSPGIIGEKGQVNSRNLCVVEANISITLE